MVPNLINVSHGTIQFVLYNELKKKLGKKNLVNEIMKENPLKITFIFLYIL